MDTLELRINHTVETLKTNKGAEWLLEQLQALVLSTLPINQAKQKIAPPSLGQTLTCEDKEERLELATFAMQNLPDIEDEYSYSLEDLKWVNPLCEGS